LEKYPESKVAILVKQRGQNVNSIIENLELNKIPYFFGLFTDEDANYLSFHRKCLYEFIELIRLKESITKKLAKVEKTLKLTPFRRSKLTPLRRSK
jgi:DNA helicase-2/ATP-dependent DNA helicase PcrA